MKKSKAQIVATIGPSSARPDILKSMIEHQLDVVRLNFSWSDFAERTKQIILIHELEKECGRHIPIIIDLPGPRVQEQDVHVYDNKAVCSITENDKLFIKFAVDHHVDYVAVSFVGSEIDVDCCRDVIKSLSGTTKVIAKIERAVALESLDKIIASADAIMVARGDLGNEVPLEQIPFVQRDIIEKSKKAGKPVITATQMLLSMQFEPTPTRAEVTDVNNAILEGSDAVMLSEETAIGKYPVEAVAMMEKIVLEAEVHMGAQETINSL